MAVDPASNQIRWPAEWEPHAATWLAWPHNADTWPKNLKAAQREFAEFARTLGQAETVYVLCGKAEIENARALLGKVRHVELVELATNDAWIRDYGPTFVEANGTTAIVDWKYNAWGGKYPPFDKDAAVAGRIAKYLSVASRRVDLFLEGGAIEGNGDGIVMTTRSCLLNANRNRSATEASINSVLSENLGAEKVCWLSGGEIDGDDTDCHIDQIARFVSADTIVISAESDSTDANYATLRQVKRELNEFNSQHGNPFSVIELPMPQRVVVDNVRLPASYANLYFANEFVVVPQFDDPNDARAISILRELISREVIGLPCRNLVVGLGSFHCLSQQQPQSVKGNS